MEKRTQCVDLDGNLYIFGYNICGQLGLGDTSSRYLPIKHSSLSNVIDISSQGVNTFVKTSNSEIFGFGNNRYSQLGIKTEDNQLILLEYLKVMIAFEFSTLEINIVKKKELLVMLVQYLLKNEVMSL